ncbi:MAG: hypothetical protein H6618_02085 [Deltaproteobacteria bacterium]|nr:hypothetical protein [Deltaproteobacteria bacterium]
MRFLTSCPAGNAILFLALPDSKGVFRFPSVHSRYPGLHFQPDHRRPLCDQFIRVVSDELGEPVSGMQIEIFQDFCEMLPGHDSCVYAGRFLQPRHLIRPHWLPLPLLLKQMPSDRSRLPFLKAWQLLSGVHKEDLRAIEYRPPSPAEGS